MDSMNDAQMWAVIVGFAMPLIVSALQDANWSNPVRTWVSFFACLIAGAGTVVFTNTWQGGLLPTASTVLLVLVTAIASYKGFWKTSGITKALERNS